MNARRYASIVWLRRSVCPSVWGWKAVDILGRMPDSHRNSCHISEVKRESQSEMMYEGSPWCFQTSRAKMTARSAAIFFSSLRGRKCAIFVNRSITTHNWLHPSESGSSVMKSIALDCQGAYGSSRGEESPYGWCRAALFFWHSGQLRTKSIILSFIFGHQKLRRISSIVLSWPIWPAIFGSCSDPRIKFLRLPSSGIQSIPFR